MFKIGGHDKKLTTVSNSLSCKNPIKEESIEFLMGELEKIGKIGFISQSKHGWSVKTEVSTNLPGITAELHSGFRHKSLKDALVATLKISKG